LPENVSEFARELPVPLDRLKLP